MESAKDTHALVEGHTDIYVLDSGKAASSGDVCRLGRGVERVEAAFGHKRDVVLGDGAVLPHFFSFFVKRSWVWFWFLIESQTMGVV